MSSTSFLDTIPGLQPPPGVTPNFANPENSGYIIITVGSILLVLMVLFLANRFYTKLFIARRASWDDLTCGIAALGSIAYFTALAIGVVDGPLGKHQWDVKLGAVTGDHFIIGVAFLSSVLVSPTLLFAKLTFFILYLELFRPLRWLRICVYVGGTLTAAFYVASGVAQIILASPKTGETWLSHALSPDEVMLQRISVYFSGVGLAIDIYLLILPLIAVSDLHLPTRRKFGVGLIFLTGLLACVASTLSIYFRVVDNRTYDTTYATENVVLSGLVEMYVGVIVSCMPSFSRSLQHHLPLYKSLRSKLSNPFSSLRSRKAKYSEKHSPGSSSDYSHLDSPNTARNGSESNMSDDTERGLAASSPVPYEMIGYKGIRTHIVATPSKPISDRRIHMKREIWQDR